MATEIKKETQLLDAVDDYIAAFYDDDDRVSVSNSEIEDGQLYESYYASDLSRPESPCDQGRRLDLWDVESLSDVVNGSEQAQSAAFRASSATKISEEEEQDSDSDGPPTPQKETPPVALTIPKDGDMSGPIGSRTDLTPTASPSIEFPE